MNLFKIIVIILISLLSSCKVDKVPSSESVHLTIASDYLEASDTTLFTLCSDSLNITIEILKMSADQLIGETRNKGFNTGIDIVMMKSVFDVNRLRRLNVFHPLENTQLRNVWYDHNVIPLALDHFLLVDKSHSTSNAMDTISDPLTYQVLTNEELAVYLSFNFDYIDPILISASVNKAKESYTKNLRDLWQCNKLILLKSDYDMLSKDSLFRQFNWEKPITTSSYNALTVGILNQSPNYNKTLDFVNLMRGENFLNLLTHRVKLFEISSYSDSLQLNLKDRIQYFSRVEKILR